MSHAIVSRKRTLVHAPVTALALASAALNGWWATATAQESSQARQVAGVQAPGRPLAELEAAFWACDHAAAVRGILDASTAIPCGVATEDLRLRKFNGDFHAMLSWWQRSKEREHRALDDTRRRAARLR